MSKQYSREEYFALRRKIIEHMRKTGEWGEFFPVSLAPVCYNETVAQEYFPLDRDEALARGYKWKDPDPRDYEASSYKVPDSIQGVGDEILGQTLRRLLCLQDYYRAFL